MNDPLKRPKQWWEYRDEHLEAAESMIGRPGTAVEEKSMLRAQVHATLAIAYGLQGIVFHLSLAEDHR